MNLIEENFEKVPKVDNSKKISKIILIAIVVLMILIFILLGVMFYIKKNTLKVTLDGKANEKVKEMILFEDDGTVYIPIREIASYLGYESYNGDYSNKSEEINKCYVQSENEIANFSLNSNKIYKTVPNSTNYDYYYIDKPVKSKDGKLYTTIQGIETAFNVSFSYNKDDKRIVIYTMPYLISAYQKAILDLGYTEMSDEFQDQKTILSNMLIVKNEKGKYGVINIANKETVLEAKYSNIQYIPTTGDFLVEDSKKVGIVSNSGKTKISLLYDSIELLDTDNNLYVVERDKKYGVVDIKGNTKITLDYDQIGIDASKFEKNDIKNKYLLAENLIPAKKGEYWGFFDKNGNKVVDFQFDSIGYIATSNKEANNLLVIPDYNVVVACKNKKYVLINSSGELLWGGAGFDDVYMTVSSTEKRYYIMANNKKYDAEVQLDRIGVSSKKENESTSNNNQENANEVNSSDTSKKNTNTTNTTNTNND